MSMLFRVISKGELVAGCNMGDVLPMVQAQLKLSSENVGHVFSGKKIVLKKGLSARQAQHFIEWLGNLGLHAYPEMQRENLAASDAEEDVKKVEGLLYRIQFAGGVMGGYNQPDVMAEIQRRWRVGVAQLESMFSGKVVTVKTRLSEKDARRYLDELSTMGMRVYADPALPEDLVEANFDEPQSPTLAEAPAMPPSMEHTLLNPGALADYMTAEQIVALTPVSITRPARTDIGTGSEELAQAPAGLTTPFPSLRMDHEPAAELRLVEPEAPKPKPKQVEAVAATQSILEVAKSEIQIPDQRLEPLLKHEPMLATIQALRDEPVPDPAWSARTEAVLSSRSGLPLMMRLERRFGHVARVVRLPFLILLVAVLVLAWWLNG